MSSVFRKLATEVLRALAFKITFIGNHDTILTGLYGPGLVCEFLCVPGL